MPLIVAHFDKVYGKSVKVVGYLDIADGSPRLIPSREHSALRGPSSVLSLKVYHFDALRPKEIEESIEQCAGKITYVSGKAMIWSGLPAIRNIYNLSC
ncbi:hypothetical protein MNKW57_30900 [Biformimicrobium ophioploci]|uniref:Uncharacterized protein n=1 Tax=Biformimicrobium ophioploci TaxID=3036711 RepID=A0ABQ6M341_9GAMM|nr:hypothetical protein MNKW57_30900 [Microbulbifer sp. NKW57]